MKATVVCVSIQVNLVKLFGSFFLPIEKPLAKGHDQKGYGGRVFSAIRLKNGNTLIGGGNNHTVLEVSPNNEIVWRLDQNELPGVSLSWVTTVEVLPNGNYLIGNCHAGPNQPAFIEVDPKSKELIWSLNNFKVIGNNSSNALALTQRLHTYNN